MTDEAGKTKWIKNSSVIVLALISLFSVYYSVATQIKIGLPVPAGIDNIGLLITLVSLIGIYLCVDHLGSAGELDDRLSDIIHTLRRGRGGIYYDTFSDLWGRITHLASFAEREVLVVVSNDDFIPAKEWEQRLSKRIQESYRSTRAYIRYDVLVITSKPSDHADCVSYEHEWQLWKQTLPDRLRPQVRLSIRNSQPIGLTAVIIDQSHVCICMATKGKGNTDVGLVFEGNPDLGSRMATWFNVQFTADLLRSEMRAP